MITQFIIDSISGVLTGLLALLPLWEFPATATRSVAAEIGQKAAWGNGYFPLTHLMIAVGIFVGFRSFGAIWTVIVWIYDRIPLKFT